MMALDQIVFCKFLKDNVIVEEGKSIILECMLNDTIQLEDPGRFISWQKNTNLIISTENIKIRSNGPWQMLEIKCTTNEDEGIYCFVVKTTTVSAYTKCLVYVKKQHPDNITSYFPDSFQGNVGVHLHLRNCNIAEGTNIILRAEFNTRVKTCKWYKNNHLIPERYPRSLMELGDYSTSQLFIENAVKSDSGIYLVVAKTYKKKYMCSHSELLVSGDFIDVLFNNENVPHIWQTLTNFTEVYEMDDVLLLFKVSYNHHTIIEFTKDGTEVKYNDKIKCETYCNKYIALKLHDVNTTHSGKYFLILRCDSSPNAIEICSSSLLVKRYTLPRPPACTVSKPLKPTIVSVGDALTFRCRYTIPELKYTYVVWIVGHNKIEKSNERFKVMCNGNDFILFIPAVIPDMAGEVTCQLRQHVPPRQSILLSSTSSHLAVLPPQLAQEIYATDNLIKENHIYRVSHLKILVSEHRSGLEPDYPSGGRSSKETIMQFQFCRTSGDKFFFDLLYEGEGAEDVAVDVEKKAIADPNALFPTCGDWNISWTRLNRRDWYVIEVGEANGQYSEIGTGNTPSFDIKEPPEDKILKFRVRTVKPRKKRNQPNICYVPDEVKLRDSTVGNKILLYKEFKKIYINDIKIGRGSFGHVQLVRRRDGEVLSAKITKFVERVKWEQVTREFHVMKNIFHPNTVALVDGFCRKNANGIIHCMEYLWGGELTERMSDRENLCEDDVVIYVRQILLALEYLHSKKIAHLDLKPENIMCIHRNSRFIKLIDFGMARIFPQAITLPTMYGSRDFVSPEMIHGELVGISCDMWSLGVLTYWLLTGRMPFVGSTWMERSRNISRVRYYYDDADHRTITDRAKMFVSYLLRRHADDRMTAIMALNNDWITVGPDKERPRKVLVPRRGGMVLIDLKVYVESVWKVLFLVAIVAIKFRRRLRRFRIFGRQHTGRRCSARLLQARRNCKNFSAPPY